AAGSLIMACADRHRVPAGAALAVERFGFGRAVTTRLALHPRVRIERRVIDDLPEGPTIVTTGPLTGGALAGRLQALCGDRRMYFYDAIAPIVAADSIDPERSFRASRWGVDSPDDRQQGAEGDYINCPLTEAEYHAFVEALLGGRKVVPHEFEEPRYFESCLPIEVMAARGLDVLRHGPMRPFGLADPRTGLRPHAVVQLRPENRWLTSYNLVGFQTRLAYPEQARVFQMIPALAGAEFLRFGSIHRNTYLDAPNLLGPELELRARPEVRFGGLLTGVEGYIESCAMGLLAALFQAARLRGQALPPPPPTTALGGLYHHVSARRAPDQRFAPTNINFGLLPELSTRGARRDKKQRIADRAAADFAAWWPGAAARAA
ncbi:MAG TPA: methylenetetrahydrofolate--tRNA-(uracil(54)-C(5))-methyltransferase (FADH(2)-oxidizing) TrmFO, partial [Kofleriaceae bacterium]|nr:methylenetetrahydrofolate--tRNA-(uracil(54)-C(5))-methyltransferase (FADH(2)-oxidizing) TrmFO [Kofleriaceae bacterium]